MKKKKVKLALNAQKVSSLSKGSSQHILGGGYPTNCGGCNLGGGAVDTRINTCYCPPTEDCPTANDCPPATGIVCPPQNSMSVCEGNTYPTACNC